MIRVLIADDHPVVRRGLRQILEEEPDLQVSGEAAGGDELRARLAGDTCDVLVLDLSMPGVHGVDLLQEIHHRLPQMAILVLSMLAEEQYALRCLKAGARGYVHKQSAGDELVGAIRTVMAGRRYLSDALAESLLREVTPERRPRHEGLSAREHEVFSGLVDGRTVSEIAARMGLSVKTVSTYRTRMLEKLGVASNAEAVRYAVEHHLFGL